jgi:hypothetical protein
MTSAAFAGEGNEDERGGGSRDGGERVVRWTLADWLAEKEQFRIEDQWLALHRTSGWFALELGGGSESYSYTDKGTTTSQTATDIDAGLWLSIFGLNYLYENSNEDWSRQSASVNLRLFGTHARSTYFNVGFGERWWSFSNPTSSVANSFIEAKLNLYIFRIFGIEGQYDDYLTATASDQSTYSGNKVQYGAFFEIGFLRIGAREILETTNHTPSGGALDKQTRNGTELELGFFF